jgi:hypothetical protein
MELKHLDISVLILALKRNFKEKNMTLTKRGLAMNFSKKTFAVASLAAAVSLAGCSSDNPDDGTTISKTSISGTAVDGYIAGATVYVDSNNNGRKNAGESSAITDKDGYFSIGKDGTNYCADDATAFQKIHCLKAAGVETGAVVRTFGGFDLFTGEPFTGSLAARVTVEDGVVASQMVTPLTSLLVDVSDTDDQEDLLGFFGLIEDDLKADFLDSDVYNTDSVKHAGILNSAIKLHKVVTLFSEVFSDKYEEFGVERSFPESPSAIIYKALAGTLGTLTNSAELTRDKINSIFDDAQSAISNLYLENTGEDDGINYPGAIDTNTKSKALDNAVAILGLIDNAIPSSTSFDNAKSRVIGVETVVKKMVDGDSDVAEAVTELGKTDSTLYTAINDALGKVNGDIDFSALTQVDYSNPQVDPNNYNIGIESNNSFANLENKQLYLSFGEQNNANGSGYLFFNSEEGASGGELKFCLRYDDGEVEYDDFGKEILSFGETDGVLLSGMWLSLDNSSKLVLKLSGALTVSLTDKGMKDTKYRYSLSYGDRTRSWLSDDGLLDNLDLKSITDQPSDHSSCKALLEEGDDA